MTAIFMTACKDEPNGGDKGYVVITFVTNWDELTIDPIVVDGTEDKFMPDDPMRPGYTFAGWYYDQVFTVLFTTGESGKLELTGDITLYAKWIKNTASGGGIGPDPAVNEEGFKFLEEGSGNFNEITYTVVGYNGSATDIIIPRNFNMRPVTKIADGAFRDNKTLTSVQFGSLIQSVGAFAFRGCTSLKSITVASDNSNYRSVDGILYNEQMTTLVVAPQKARIDSLTFAKSVVNIADYALEGCAFAVAFRPNSGYVATENLDFAGFKGKFTVTKNILEIHDGSFAEATCEIEFATDCEMSTIWSGAFSSYRGEKLVLPSTVTGILGHAFSGCTAVVDLSKTGLREIGENAFARYNGATLVIPASVNKIGRNAFYNSTADVTFAENSQLTEVGESAFAYFGVSVGNDNGTPVYAGSVRFPSTVTTVMARAFQQARATVYFDCAEGDLSIASGAFDAFYGSCVYLKN